MAHSNEKLKGLRILVAEDDFIVLLDIESMLEELGCEIVGPVATVEGAVDAISRNAIDGALLDMNLHGELITPAAVKLVAQGIPFVICTGYGREPRDEAVIRDAPRLIKPFNLESLRAAMGEILLNVARE